MTLTAIDPIKKTRFWAPGYVDIRNQLPKDIKLVCPITESPVIPISRGRRKDGVAITAHFRKLSGYGEWPEDVLWDEEYVYNGRFGESIEHLRTKEMIVSSGNDLFDFWDSKYATTELRVWIPSKHRFRIADVAYDGPDYKMVVEVQYSKITTDELQQRTEDYFEAGWDVQWVFGPKNLGGQCEEWHENFIKYPAITAEINSHQKDAQTF